MKALPKTLWGDARGRGFLGRLRAAGAATRIYEPHECWRAASELESLAKWLSGLPRPVGIFACNDVFAKADFAAYSAARGIVRATVVIFK